jgi:cell division protein FtsB
MKKWKIRPSQILVIGAFILGFFLLMNFFERLTELSRLSTQRDQAKAEVTAMNGTLQALLTNIAYATQSVAVEEWARDEAHMAKPGDVLIIPVAPVSGTAEPVNFPVQTPEPVPNWQVWWSLFFGN